MVDIYIYIYIYIYVVFMYENEIMKPVGIVLKGE
jgi:hypothetical protein